MKLLISGSGGLFGGALVRHAEANGHICTALDRAMLPIQLGASGTNFLYSLFDDADHFVHAAANTDVERCELDPATCFRDNVLLTEFLVAAARRCGVPMTFISSTGVYGARQKTPWAEYHETHPETHHHRSKLLGEQRVIAADMFNLVIRTGWLFGGNGSEAKNFVAKRIQEALTSQNGFITSNDQQRGCPTFVDDLAVRVMDLINLRAYGVFNVVNLGFASRFEYVTEIIRLAGLNVEVRSAPSEDFKRIAPVSDNEMALNWRADSLGLPPMRSWQCALNDYLTHSGIKVRAL
jgi:dTDP-4-dehydrorhamnose reductase